MRLTIVALASIATFAAASVLGFLAVFFLVGATGCPPEVRVCDLPGIAGFGLGIVAAPVVGAFAASLTWRKMRRGQADSREVHSP